MSNSGLSIKDEALREVAFDAITNSYTALEGPFEHDAFIDSFVNEMDVDIYISFDGVTNHKKLGSQSGRVSDLKANDAYRKAGTQVYVKYGGAVAPTLGWFAVEVSYT